MIFRNLKIGTQLILTNSVIVLLIIAAMVIAYIEASKIIKYTDELYNHPYHVGRAVRDISTNCAEIHSLMKDVVFNEGLSDVELHEIEHNIELLENETYSLFDIVYERYLGERALIDSSYSVFTEWKLLRDNLIFMRQHGTNSEIIETYSSINQPYVAELKNNVDVMVEFETAKAQSFFTGAMSQSRSLLLHLVLAIASIILLKIIISYNLIRNILEPLKGLEAAADSYSLGNYSAEFNYKSANEFGKLATTFSNMARGFRETLQQKEKVNKLAFVMHGAANLRELAESVMLKIAGFTNSQVAAFYLFDNDSGKFRHLVSSGMDVEKMTSFSADSAEGEFGILCRDKNINILKEISPDTVFTYKTTIGNIVPREIVSIPVLNRDNTVAVITLASVHEYTAQDIQWLYDIRPLLNEGINGAIASQGLMDYSRMVDLKNRELGEKNKELSQQADELKEYNLELDLQKKQLNQASQLKTSFLSNMSHELRTPLNSVIALSSVLSKKLRDKIGEEEYKYIEIIEKNGKNLLTLINEILDLSRIESGKETITPSLFSLNDLVASILENLDPQIKQKDIKVLNLVSPDMPYITSDRKKCRHILQNIIHNAVKFTDSGSVEIDARNDDGVIHISVRDTGIGISSDQLSLIFDEFRQADERSSRVYGGTGLGLAIAQKYCTMLGGKIEVDSIYGEGSVFRIKIPANMNISEDGNDITGDFSYAGASGNSKDHRNSFVGKTVLIIEDSPEAIIQISDILGDEGLNVEIARNAGETFEIISREVPDAIILDLMMPVTDGFEVLKRLRNLESTMYVPVLILTAKHVSKEELSVLKKNNVSQLIQKGAIRKDELINSIRRMLKTESESITSAKRHISRIGHHGKPSVLIIEDNSDNMISVKAILDDNYTIYEASDGSEGLRIARAMIPDIILLDISLPVMDGFTVLDQIRREPALEKIPVIALSAKAFTEDREEFMRYGFDSFVSKPVDSSILFSTIENFITKNINDKDSGN